MSHLSLRSARNIFLPRQVVAISFALALPVKPRQVVAQLCGAGDGTRTRDNLLGRQGLCQLSYSRKANLF